MNKPKSVSETTYPREAVEKAYDYGIQEGRRLEAERIHEAIQLNRHEFGLSVVQARKLADKVSRNEGSEK